MFGTQDLALFTLTVFVLNVTPGVDMAFTLLSTLRGGVRSGLAAAAGICAGCMVHTLAAAFGLAALMAASNAAFNAIKWAGAAYLLWLAIGMIRQGLRGVEAAVAGEPPNPSGRSATQVFRQGFLTNVLNPKVALFSWPCCLNSLQATHRTRPQPFCSSALGRSSRASFSLLRSCSWSHRCVAGSRSLRSRAACSSQPEACLRCWPRGWHWPSGFDGQLT